MKKIAHIAGWRRFFADEMNGLRTGNESLLRSLLEYGSFEQMDLFLPDLLIPEFKKHWGPFIEKISNHKTLKIEPLWQFPFHLEKEYYDLLLLSDPTLERITPLREALARHPCPVAGITHSLHHYGNSTYALELLLAPTQPCDSIICTSQAGKTVLEKALAFQTQKLNQKWNGSLSYRGRLDVLPLGVTPPETLPISIQEIRQTIDLPDKDLIILCNGRISIFNKMDHIPLLLALKEIIQVPGLEKTKLVIAGAVNMNDPYLGSLTLRATQLGLENHVLFKLNYESWVKPYLYQAADIVVSIPDNTQETFGIAPVEAMLCGKPVVLSDWNGHAELIEDGVHGFKIPTYWAANDPVVDFMFPYAYDQALFYMAQSVAVDVPMLTQRLMSLLQNEPLRKKMGEQARVYAHQTFTWEKLIPRYEQLWAQLLAQSQAYNWPAPTYQMNAPSIYNIFAHYASHTIQPTDWIACTPYGSQIEKKQASMNLYPTVTTWINGATIFDLLAQTQKPIQLQSLLEKIPHPAPLVTYLILWAIKNDLLSLKID